MRGPFDYGCLLTLSGRHEGYTSPGVCCSFSSMLPLVSNLFPNLRSLWHVDPCHSQKKYKGFWRLWLCCFFRMVRCQASKLHQFRQSQYVLFSLLICNNFDNSKKKKIFLVFSSYLRCIEKNFSLQQRGLRRHAPSLPLYKRAGKVSDLPVDSLVSVFFAMSSYTKRIPGSSSAPASGASFNNILSLNLHYVVYYGIIPRDV
jgi:hypothetical protein